MINLKNNNNISSEKQQNICKRSHSIRENQENMVEIKSYILINIPVVSI